MGRQKIPLVRAARERGYRHITHRSHPCGTALLYAYQFIRIGRICKHFALIHSNGIGRICGLFRLRSAFFLFRRESLVAWYRCTVLPLCNPTRNADSADNRRLARGRRARPGFPSPDPMGYVLQEFHLRWLREARVDDPFATQPFDVEQVTTHTLSRRVAQRAYNAGRPQGWGGNRVGAADGPRAATVTSCRATCSKRSWARHKWEEQQDSRVGDRKPGGVIVRASRPLCHLEGYERREQPPIMAWTNGSAGPLRPLSLRKTVTGRTVCRPRVARPPPYNRHRRYDRHNRHGQPEAECRRRTTSCGGCPPAVRSLHTSGCGLGSKPESGRVAKTPP